MALALFIAASPVSAEDLVSGLSQDTIQITSNYTGTDIVVFGAIERAEDTAGRDIVVIVRGPDAPMVVRRRDRIAGIWVNRDSATFKGLPSYYFLASTQKVDKIASPETLERYGIGLENLEPDSVQSHHNAEPFRQALLRRQERAHLYIEAPQGVEFLSNTLFRVRVPVPATVPRGQYNAEVYLFRGGTVISAQSTPLFIDQTGLERRLFNFAHARPLYYGLSTVLMAGLLGWLSSVIFRRAG